MRTDTDTILTLQLAIDFFTSTETKPSHKTFKYKTFKDKTFKLPRKRKCAKLLGLTLAEFLEIANAAGLVKSDKVQPTTNTTRTKRIKEYVREKRWEEYTPQALRIHTDTSETHQSCDTPGCTGYKKASFVSAAFKSNTGNGESRYPTYTSCNVCNK